jgi:hypothetical protein
MAVRRKGPRKVGSLRPTVERKKTPKRMTESELTRRLHELTERIDIVLPEVTARVAALEHLLLELKLCSRDDLRRARRFVQEQEAEPCERISVGPAGDRRGTSPAVGP